MAFEDDGNRGVTRRSFVALAGLGIAASVLGPMSALADDGGNTGGGGSTGSTDGVAPHFFWFDDAEAALAGTPVQGWDEASIDWAMAKVQTIYTWGPINYKMGSKNDNIGNYEEFFRKTARGALAQAIARTPGAKHARIVGVAWNEGHNGYGSFFTNYGGYTYQRAMPRAAIVGTEFTPASAWARPKAGDTTGRSYAQFLWDRYVKDDATSQWRLGVIAVSDMEPPMAQPVGLTKSIKSDEGAMNDFIKSLGGASGYSLAGCEYTVYKDAACTQRAKAYTWNADGTVGAETEPVFRTTADGTTNTLALEPALLYARETRTNDTLELDGTVVAIDMRTYTGREPKRVPVSDAPKLDPFTGSLHKIDDSGIDAQGSATLAGAQFEISFYAGVHTTRRELEALQPYCQATWQTVEVETKTGKRGRINWGVTKPVSGIWPFSRTINGEMENYQPVGTLVLRETKAPTGYDLDARWFIRTSEPSATYKHVHKYYIDNDGKVGTNWSQLGADMNGEPAIADKASEWPFYLYKIDHTQMGVVVGDEPANKMMDAHRPEGNAKFAGATFDVFNASRAPIYYKGNKIEVGGKVDTLTAGANGKTNTIKVVFGEYRVVETSAPEGYVRNLNPYTFPVQGNDFYTWSAPLEDDLKSPRGTAQGDWGDQVTYE